MADSTITAGILTISDKGALGLRKDESGHVVARLLMEKGYTVVKQGIVPDEADQIAGTLKSWADDEHLVLIVTSGGYRAHPQGCNPAVHHEHHRL